MNVFEMLKEYKPYNQQEQDDLQLYNSEIVMQDNLLERSNLQYHMSVSAWIVNETRDKVLLAYHKIYQSYTWLGGHLDGNSDALAIAYKEIEEESGLHTVHLLDEHIFSFEILSVPEHEKHGKQVAAHHHVNVTYLFEANDKDDIHINEDENDAIAWIKIEDILKFNQEKEMIPIYEKLIAKSNNNK